MDAFMLALLSALIWGIVPILEKVGLARIDPFVGLFYRCFGVLLGILLLVLFAVKPAQLKAVNPRTIFILVLSGFLASVVAQITFYHALKIGEVSKVVPVAGTYYLVSFLLGVFFLGETLTLHKIAGIILVLSGMLLIR